MAHDPVEFQLLVWREADAGRHALIERLRRIVLGVDPRITEEARYGGLLYTASSPFCGVYSYERHVALEFSRGAELPDAHQVLEGEGKKRRHIKIVDGNDLFKKNVRAYVELACAAASGKTGRPGRPAAGNRPR